MIALVSEGIDNYLVPPEAYGIESMTTRDARTHFGAVRACTGSIEGREFLYFPNSGMTETMNLTRATLALFQVLRDEGIDQLIWVGKTGAIDPTLNVGDLVVPDDYLDFAVQRKRSYWQSLNGRIRLCYEMTEPFCKQLRVDLLRAAIRVRDRFPETISTTREKGVYVCTEGPAFESRSEVGMFRALEASVVGHTLVPHVYYAKELNICLGAICIVSNICRSYKDKDVVPRPPRKNGPLEEVISQLCISAIANVGKRECDCASGKHWLRKPTELP